MYDFIGDIHGYAKHLKKLLEKLGYRKNGNSYTHPEYRKVIFVGDYVDRGALQEEVLNIVRGMVDSGDAIALMGNHEYNAICYATKINGDYLRERSDKNTAQHKAFLAEFNPSTKKYADMIEWFKTLPLFFENDGIRAVHAAWIPEHISEIRKFNNKLLVNEEVLHEVYKKGDLHNAIETTLKGPEIHLPDNGVWADKDGYERNTIRFNWYDKHLPLTYRARALSVHDLNSVPDIIVPAEVNIYTDRIPVLFGHYWMKGEPMIQHKYAACIDYSIAIKGCLVAYRWNGEEKLTNDHFVFEEY